MRCAWCVPAGFVLSLGVHAAVVVPFLLNKDEVPVIQPESVITLELSVFQPEIKQQPITDEPEEPVLEEIESATEGDTKQADLIEKLATIEQTQDQITQQPKPVEKPPLANPPPATSKPVKSPEAVKSPEITQPKITQPKITKPKVKVAKLKKTSVVSPSQASASSTLIKKQESTYKQLVRRAIEKKKYYPAKARRKRAEGRVVVGFTLLPNGSFRNLRIVNSSGKLILDKAALKAVKKVGRFPPFPKYIQRESWAIKVPLNYQVG